MMESVSGHYIPLPGENVLNLLRVLSTVKVCIGNFDEFLLMDSS